MDWIEINSLRRVQIFASGKYLSNKDPANDTGGIFYCRDSVEINGSGSLQTSYRVDSDVLRNRQQKHTSKPLVAMWHGRPSWPPVKEKEYKIKSSWELQRKILIFREA
ncbi:hypothetical protein C0T31_02250 [Dysgonamonadaceae bacterium]|nr:hypothetical protein C0T31_02250 [Dysgonamonadaceae bacterium]